ANKDSVYTKSQSDARYVRTIGGIITGPINYGSTPVASSELVNKAYVDALASGLSWKDAVVAATTANITLSGLQGIDGVSVSSGQRVLVKNQSDSTENGVYIAASGAWSRSTDATTGTQIKGMAVYVDAGGVTNGGTQWVNSNTSAITVGTTGITYTQFGATNVTVPPLSQVLSAGDSTSHRMKVGDLTGTSVTVPDLSSAPFLTTDGTGLLQKGSELPQANVSHLGDSLASKINLKDSGKVYATPQTVEDTGKAIRQTLDSAFNHITYTDSSVVYPYTKSWQFEGILGPDSASSLEIINIGAHPDIISPLQHTPSAIVKYNWSTDLTRNVWLDKDVSGLPQWNVFDTAFPAAILEVGNEGITAHVVPHGHPSLTNYPHESFQVRPGLEADGTVYEDTLPFIQGKTTYAMRYDTTQYFGSTSGSWGYSKHPFIWLFSEVKADSLGLGNEFLSLDQYTNDNTEGGFLTFKRSRGSYKAKTSVAKSDSIGGIKFYGYDGNNFIPSSEIRSIVDGSVSGNNVPTSLQILTGSNNSEYPTATFTSGGWVGIGTTSPVSMLNLLGDAGAYVRIDRFNADSSVSPIFLGLYGRASSLINGAPVNPQSPLKGSILVNFAGSGYDAASYPSAYLSGELQFLASENWTSTHKGSFARIMVTDSGSITRKTAVTINQGGTSIAGELAISNTPTGTINDSVLTKGSDGNVNAISSTTLAPVKSVNGLTGNVSLGLQSITNVGNTTTNDIDLGGMLRMTNLNGSIVKTSDTGRNFLGGGSSISVVHGGYMYAEGDDYQGDSLGGSLNFALGNATSPSFKWYGAASGEKMILTAAGDLGIGTTTPSAKLDVNGTTKSDTFYYTNPPANTSAATKFLGLSSDGHTISTRTATQVLSDIGAASSTNVPTLSADNTFTGFNYFNGPGIVTNGYYEFGTYTNPLVVIGNTNNNVWIEDYTTGKRYTLVGSGLTANRSDTIPDVSGTFWTSGGNNTTTGTVTGAGGFFSGIVGFGGTSGAPDATINGLGQFNGQTVSTVSDITDGGDLVMTGTVRAKGIIKAIRTVTDSTAITLSDYTIICNITANAGISTPASGTCTGQVFAIVNNAATAVTLTVYDSTGTVITTVSQHGHVSIQSDGTNWYVISD
ncbi:MAG: hypothetical protein ACREHG_09895, partial [Candidatus Saccharimonadales bacterium]